MQHRTFEFQTCLDFGAALGGIFAVLILMLQTSTHQVWR